MSDQGKILYEKLSQLKYPKIGKFNPSSFDWLFDNEEALPFLNWFCQAVQPALHLLSDSELKKCDALKKSGVTLLEGQRLKEALETQAVAEVSNEDLEAEIELLRLKKDNLLNLKQSSIRKLNQLNAREKSISSKISSLEDQANTTEANAEKLIEKLGLQNGIFKESMESLLKTTTNVTECFSQSKLLCQSSFDHFLKYEEDYTSLLTKYANSQFEENMGAMGQNSGSEMCAFVKVGDPNIGEILGLDPETRVIQNWELNRLQKLLPLAEEDRIVSETESAALQGGIQACKTIINDLVGGKFPSSPARIKLTQDEMDQRNADYYKEYLSLRNDVLNAIKKSTHIRCSTVIVGDCSLKLLRQEYFISKQKEFLTFLAQQWAREQLVILALRLEGRQLDSMIATLKSIAQQVDSENKELEQRLIALKEVIDSDKTLRERNTIPSSDVVARSLLAVLEPGSKNIINNYEDLSRAAATLRRQLNSTVSNYDHLAEQQVKQQQDLDKIVLNMEELVFGCPLTSVTQPLSRSGNLSQAIQKLDGIRENVKTRFVPLYKDFKAKQLGVKNDHLTALERRLWTLFYTDPGSMQRKTEALHAKANAF